MAPLPENVKLCLAPLFPGLDLNKIDIRVGVPEPLKKWAGNPRALTIGNVIYFRKGQYNPSTSEGISLVAHEIKHSYDYQKYGHKVFLISYFGQYGCNRARKLNEDDAYDKISFEKEANRIEREVFKSLKNKGTCQ